mgnify:CR=1 FL=1
MKKIVVYYSYTGNTKKIANMIKEKLNCDILELTPKIPFSTDYQAVVDEYQNNPIQNKSVGINDIKIDLNEYDEIIIGTPVWWYTISPVVVTFLKNFNLDNKTIIPFATNAGWLGKTFKDIEKLCPNSKIEKEMNIVFESYSDKLKTDEKEIDNWIDKL